MHPVALVLLEAEITDELVSRTRKLHTAAGLSEPTDPAQFRTFLVALIAELQRADQRGTQLRRLQHYNRCLVNLGVEVLDTLYIAPARMPAYVPQVA